MEAENPKTEIPEPEENKSEKEEKKLEEDPDDKVQTTITNIPVPSSISSKKGINSKYFRPSHLPEIQTPPPEALSF